VLLLNTGTIRKWSKEELHITDIKAATRKSSKETLYLLTEIIL
jgi:hypothetical protein